MLVLILPDQLLCMWVVGKGFALAPRRTEIYLLRMSLDRQRRSIILFRKSPPHIFSENIIGRSMLLQNVEKCSSSIKFLHTFQVSM